jgi:hypothetical protein
VVLADLLRRRASSTPSAIGGMPWPLMPDDEPPSAASSRLLVVVELVDRAEVAGCPSIEPRSTHRSPHSSGVEPSGACITKLAQRNFVGLMPAAFARRVAPTRAASARPAWSVSSRLSALPRGGTKRSSSASMNTGRSPFSITSSVIGSRCSNGWSRNGFFLGSAGAFAVSSSSSAFSHTVAPGSTVTAFASPRRSTWTALTYPSVVFFHSRRSSERLSPLRHACSSSMLVPREGYDCSRRLPVTRWARSSACR